VRAIAAAGLVALALLAAVARPAPAAAATPCWKLLLNDWYDGRIDNTYPIHCYKDALHHLPADVQTYSSAHDDILRALQSAKARLRRAGTAATPNTPVVPPGGGSGTKTTSTGTGTNGSTTAPEPTSPEPGRDPGTGLGGAAASINHSSPSSVPTPLIVLGALAILLVAAGAVGLVVKRRQGP
jgi:cobalamin biosynthesis Mg chelatase CobN